MNVLILGTISGLATEFINKMRFGNKSISNIYHLGDSVDFSKTLELMETIPHLIDFTIVPGYDEEVDSTDIIFIYEYKKKDGKIIGVCCEEFALINDWWKSISLKSKVSNISGSIEHYYQ